MTHHVSLSADQRDLFKSLLIRGNTIILLASILALGFFALSMAATACHYERQLAAEARV
ncbi:hypothetical protein SM0020_12385 [Sinorhizobium meliloti CCNWSX0020]|uniref:Uncharacterized protein n=1 Tax=Sinorhizobium meliloti CCNWSX0020 TaxID=1107881 RepID=H0FZ43_RHIML|nr:hypothetical protein [Sinorhizobium meliloti]EHK77723.1 hypothetical protein SM0020_12385 [Sinorhizobium meliloti CCNWSX0020]